MLTLNLEEGSRLTLEATERFGICNQPGQQELDGNALLELQMEGLHHHAHASAPNRPFDAILARNHGAGLDQLADGRTPFAAVFIQHGDRIKRKKSARSTVAQHNRQGANTVVVRPAPTGAHRMRHRGELMVPSYGWRLLIYCHGP